MKWKVSTCGKTLTVTATDPFKACVAAVKTKKLMDIGALMAAIPANEKPNDDNTFYCSSVKVCEAAGLLVS